MAELRFSALREVFNREPVAVKVPSPVISDYFGEELGTPASMNVWIPDGMKDMPADRMAPRQRLIDALDQILNAPVPNKHHIVAVCKYRFGFFIGQHKVGRHVIKSRSG